MIIESVIERARPEDSFNQIREEMRQQHPRNAKTKLITLKAKLLPNKPKSKLVLSALEVVMPFRNSANLTEMTPPQPNSPRTARPSRNSTASAKNSYF